MSAINYPTFASPSRQWRLRSAGRFETLVVAAGICLPVPLLAVTGLSVPLPNVVERIAAALVPWAEPVAFESGEIQGAIGTIVPTAAEAAPAAAAPEAHGTLPASASRSLQPGVVPKNSASRAVAPAAVAPSARPTAPGGHTVARTASDAPAAVPAATHPEVNERTEAAVPAAAEPTATPRTESRPAAEPARATSTPGTTTPAPTTPAPTPEPAPQPKPTTPVVVQTPVVTVSVPVPTPVAPVVEPVVTIVNNTVADPVGTVGGIVANPGGTVGGILKPILPKLGGK
jgi:hypothetical protein